MLEDQNKLQTEKYCIVLMICKIMYPNNPVAYLIVFVASDAIC